jgi:hypothetical protein
LEAVITQENRPIVFLSRKLSKMQQKYNMTKIELLAIVETLKEFKGMLWGQSIKVFTDHKNLTGDALGLTSKRVYQWRLLLEEYAPEIIYINRLGVYEVRREQKKRRQYFLVGVYPWQKHNPCALCAQTYIGTVSNTFIELIEKWKSKLCQVVVDCALAFL